jgi:hypothetical protein
MRRLRLRFGAALLAVLALPAVAQTNIAPAANPPADTAPPAASGPVVMPPAAASPATPALDVPDNSAPAASLPGTANTKQEEIADIRPPFFFLHSWAWLWIALGVAALLALLLLVWKWLSGRATANAKTAYDLALENLEKARELMREDNPTPYAVAVSEAIRLYLGQRFQSPSTRRTTEEFLRQMEHDPATPLAEHRDLLGAFLRSCDLVKFARYRPTLAELEEVQQRALGFVHATKPAEPAEAGAARLTPAASTP